MIIQITRVAFLFDKNCIAGLEESVPAYVEHVQCTLYIDVQSIDCSNLNKY